MSNNLKEIWSKIDKGGIRRIILFRGEDMPPKDELIEIPQECLEGYIEVLDRAMHKLKTKDVTVSPQGLRLKIFTDSNEYIIPCEWMFSGEELDFTTHMELWNYLEGCQVWKPEFRIFHDTTGWTKCHGPRKIWPALKEENIRRIIFCYAEDYNKADDWVVKFEVPQECLQGAIGLLDKAMQEQKKIYNIPDAWMGFSGMKIITDKGKYLVPAGWDSSKGRRDDTIYGSDWASSELRQYLRMSGWADPNNQADS